MAKKAPKETRQTSSELLTWTILEAIREKKGTDIAILDLRDITNTVTDFFVICNGNTNTQTSAIADSIEKKALEVHKEKPFHSEGRQGGEWILLDYYDVVVHVMLPRTRRFYDLESLWADARITRFEE